MQIVLRIIDGKWHVRIINFCKLGLAPLSKVGSEVGPDDCIHVVLLSPVTDDVRSESKPAMTPAALAIHIADTLLGGILSPP